MLVSIIIPTWRRRKLLRRLLFSIARCKCQHELEIVVADSHSPDGTSSMVARFSRRVHPVRLVQTSNALAAKRNAGARDSQADLLIFLDDDLAISDKDGLDVIIAESLSSLQPVCFRVEYPSEWRRSSNYYRFKQTAHDVTNRGPRQLRTFRFVAMAFCIRRQVFDQVSGFSERFTTYGGEDHAFEFALRRIGVAPLLSASATVHHFEASGDLYLYLRKKVVVMIRDTFPVLFAAYPESRFPLSRMLEGELARSVLHTVPIRVLDGAVVAIAWLMNATPLWTPDAVLRFIGRVGFVAAYCLAVRER